MDTRLKTTPFHPDNLTKLNQIAKPCKPTVQQTNSTQINSNQPKDQQKLFQERGAVMTVKCQFDSRKLEKNQSLFKQCTLNFDRRRPVLHRMKSQ